MPSVSKSQQRAMAIAEHYPSKLKKGNRGLLKMSHQQLHEFASTSHKGLPNHVAQKAAKKLAKKGKE